MPAATSITPTMRRARSCRSIAARTAGTREAIGALAADIQWPFIGPLSAACSGCPARAAGADATYGQPRHPQRRRAIRRSRGQQPFRAQPLPRLRSLGGCFARHLRVDWSLDRPNLSIDSTIGQSYRLSNGLDIFPAGTGLDDRMSDIVGRTRIRYGRLIDLTHRYRIDKDNFAVRRNEIDLTVGTTQTYAQIGYLKLNRNIDAAIEDLRDKEEIRSRPSPLHPLLVDLRRDGRRSDRQKRGSAVDRRRLGAGSRTVSASSTRTIACRLDLRGGTTMSASAPSTMAALSAFTWL